MKNNARSPLTSVETQVQPFNLVTPDNETLYAWHLLPPHLCREHEEKLNADEPSGPASDYTKTPAYELLANDPNARVVVACTSTVFKARTYKLNHSIQSTVMPLTSAPLNARKPTVCFWDCQHPPTLSMSSPWTIAASAYPPDPRQKKA